MSYKAVQVSKAGGDFEIVTREIPEPGKGQVLIKVEACGVCHSDAITKEGWMPVQYPRVPGHEVIGKIVKFGEGVNQDFWKIGQRIGIGWAGGHCFNCENCRRGDFVVCKSAKVTGISHDGGYAEYVITPWEAMAQVPDDLSPSEAAPLLCAGVTVFNSMRNQKHVRAGDLVAVIGIGGLGHLAVQFAAKMGFKVVAVSGGSDKKELATKLGAHIYFDYKTQDPATEIQKLGGAKLILYTATGSSEQMKKFADAALGIDGKLMVLGIPQGDVSVSPMSLIGHRSCVGGWPSGTSMDSEDTLNFSSLSGVKSMVETFSLDQVKDAYQHMMDNKVRFRSVLKFE